MKKILSLTLATILIGLSPTPSFAMADNKKDDVVLEVAGMVCDFCAQSLTKVFSKEDSVNGIDVSLEDQTVTVDVKEGKDLSDAKIKELIEWGGYDLLNIKRN